MDYIYQKVSYLKGLAEGMEIEEESKEGKLLLHIIDTLEDFADVMDEVAGNYEDLEEYVSYIDEDLSDVEDELYEFDDDEEDYFPYEDFEDLDFECDCCDDEIVEAPIDEE